MPKLTAAPIALSVDTLISESDMTGNDELMRVDVTEDMDQDRVIAILTGNARSQDGQLCRWIP